MASIARSITQFTRKEIQSLLRTAKRMSNISGLDLLAAPKKYPIGRILIIIPRSVGPAPVRNRLRRQIKAIFYENQLYTTKNDYIIFVKKEAVPYSFQELQRFFVSSITQ